MGYLAGYLHKYFVLANFFPDGRYELAYPSVEWRSVDGRSSVSVTRFKQHGMVRRRITCGRSVFQSSLADGRRVITEPTHGSAAQSDR